MRRQIGVIGDGEVLEMLMMTFLASASQY